jgi:hypothetical protein
MFDDYFFQEEFIFPDEGGVTGTGLVRCPACGIEQDLIVDVGNTCDTFACDQCGNLFSVNWNTGQASRDLDQDK